MGARVKRVAGAIAWGGEVDRFRMPATRSEKVGGCAPGSSGGKPNSRCKSGGTSRTRLPGRCTSRGLRVKVAGRNVGRLSVPVLAPQRRPDRSTAFHAAAKSAETRYSVIVPRRILDVPRGPL